MDAKVLRGQVLGRPDGTFLIAEWEDNGSQSGEAFPIAPWHLHRTEDEAWYVLEGTLCVKAGDEVVSVHPGAGVLVPAGVPHTYWNPDSAPARYLLTMGSRTRALIEAIHSAQDRSRPALEELFRRYDSELL